MKSPALKNTSLRRIMHLILATAVTDAAIACGGAITSDVDGAEPSGSGTGTASSSSSSGSSSSSSSSSSSGNTSSGDDPETDPKPDASIPDANKVDSNKPDSNKPDVITQPDVTTIPMCKTGQLDPDPNYCCADQADPNCGNGGGGGGDDDQCKLDCKTVCEKILPGSSTNGFDTCYWTASATAPKIQYVCGACGIGRVPEGTAHCPRGGSVAERLAMQAYYEAASVIAFRRLATVLQGAGAPEDLISRVLDAARDEERHAAIFTTLANDRGASVEVPEIDESCPDLVVIAIENAREGCVRETYGALVALHQAAHAEDADLRDAFASIADDEIAHAELSWDLAGFFETHLGTSHAAYRDAAAIELRAAATREHDAIDDVLGVPRPTAARAMFDELFARIAA